MNLGISLKDSFVQDLLRIFEGIRKSGFIRNRDNQEYYEYAKKLQTKDRDLALALKYYAKAAQQGEKVQSSIKDFASVLHQCGRTSQAVDFLLKFRFFAKSQDKYDNLIQNLKKQIVPSGKVFCKKLLLTNIQKVANVNDIFAMFGNNTRIQEVAFSSHLDNNRLVDQTLHTKYCIITFESFSAAKKTLQTFKFDEWFGVDKYWMTINNEIICQAFDGRVDFEKITIKWKHYREYISLECIIPENFTDFLPNMTIKTLSKEHICQSLQEGNMISIRMIKQCLSNYETFHKCNETMHEKKR